MRKFVWFLTILSFLAWLWIIYAGFHDALIPTPVLLLTPALPLGIFILRQSKNRPTPPTAENTKKTKPKR